MGRNEARKNEAHISLRVRGLRHQKMQIVRKSI